MNSFDPRWKSLSSLLPPLAGLVLLGLFVTLGMWQLDRAAEKRGISDSFTAGGDYVELSADASYGLYQPLRVSGRYLAERQFLLDNIVQESRLGYYVITPFEYAADKPLLLVNRGWIAREPEQGSLPDIGLGDDDEQVVRGRVGGLPRVGIRPGPPFDNTSSWPLLAVWPTLDDLSSALQREVLPFVLLADPEADTAFVRRWEPQQIGPMRHIGYAFQWFALALTVVVVAFVLYRRKSKPRE
ncbi:MAG: SURF1 family protein [Woeseia sp.]